MQGDFVRARLRVTTHWSAVPTLLAPHVKALPTSSIFLGKISSSATFGGEISSMVELHRSHWT
jgi:hypothetical protein